MSDTQQGHTLVLATGVADDQLTQTDGGTVTLQPVTGADAVIYTSSRIGAPTAMNAVFPRSPMLDLPAEVGQDTPKVPPIHAERASPSPPFIGAAFFEIAPYLSETTMIFMGSYLRSIQGFADIGMRLQPALTAAYAAQLGISSSPERADRQQLVEHLRALLREIGDAALFEARRLELELGDMREKLARTVAPVAEAAPYGRMWKAKP